MNNCDVKFIRNRFFDNINSYESYIMDSNIVIKFRDLFYNPDKMDINEINYWVGLLEFLKYKDVIPGMAIQELCWNFQDYKRDENKSKRLGLAIDGLFTYQDYIYNRIRKKIHYSGEVNPIKGSKRQFKSLYENSEANIILLPTFCVMLKFYYVMLKYQDNRDRYIELCNFVRDELMLVGGYELAFITDILFSKDFSKTKTITDMFKLNTKENYMQKIWNSSWDIFFIRSITALAANTMSNKPLMDIYNPILITMDKNLSIIAEFVNRKPHYEVIENQVYPGVEFGSDYSIDDFLFVRTVYEMLDSTKEKRIKVHNKMSYEERVKNCKIIIKSLEKEINDYLD